MPNLDPPVTTTTQALAYRERILATLPEGARFTPLMTLYLTDDTPPEAVTQAQESAHVVAAKYYPAGATTHSRAGVTDITKLYSVLEAMQEHGMPLLVHGEVTDPTVDVFDRANVFLERQLVPLVERFPRLRMVVEHITTKEAVEFVMVAPNHIVATITAHHLLLNRNALLAGKIHPHCYCLPVLQHEDHRKALLAAASSGNPKFFLGTDSAPHSRHAKESACGCAGIYTAHAALELYAEAFEQARALDRLEGFASFYGADFYRLPRNEDRITLVREAWQVPEQYRFGDETVVPLRAGEKIGWRLIEG